MLRAPLRLLEELPALVLEHLLDPEAEAHLPRHHAQRDLTGTGEAQMRSGV